MPHSTGLHGHELIKGHATLNDFLMLADPGCKVATSGVDIAVVCDRHNGIDADGFVHIVRITALPGTGISTASVPETEWFMDYYRTDRSMTEMCSNAARLFTHVLDRGKLCPIADGESVTIGARGGTHVITRLGELWAVGMGPACLASLEEVDDEDWDMAVDIPDLAGQRAALSAEVSDPRTAVALGEESELKAAAFAGFTDPAVSIAYDLAPEAGTSLKFVAPLRGEADPDIQSSVGTACVRVLERGAGESLSYGAGCCAVAVALYAWTGPGAPEDYRLLVPGGEIGVHAGADPLGEDDGVLLTGPTAIIGRIAVVQGVSDPPPPVLLPDVTPTPCPRRETGHHYESAIRTLRHQHHPADRPDALHPVPRNGQPHLPAPAGRRARQILHSGHGGPPRHQGAHITHHHGRRPHFR